MRETIKGSVPPPLRLGFPVKVVGREGLKSDDTRRWQKKPHLRTSIEYLHAIFDYLHEHGISMYRISSDIAPYLTHPEKTEFRNQVAEGRGELAALGKVARARRLRLSFHPSQYIILNSADDRLTTQSIHDIESQAEMLDVMEPGRPMNAGSHRRRGAILSSRTTMSPSARAMCWQFTSGSVFPWFSIISIFGV